MREKVIAREIEIIKESRDVLLKAGVITEAEEKAINDILEAEKQDGLVLLAIVSDALNMLKNQTNYYVSEMADKEETGSH